MFTHQDIWHAIDRLATVSGYSPSGLAKKAGLDPTTFNKSKRHSADGKPRWPSTESVAKVLAVTGATMSDFIALIDDSPVAAFAANDGQTARTQTIPLLGYAQAGRKGFFNEDGYPAGEGWDQIAFPENGTRRDEHCYALKITGDSMEPLYRAGDILVISPAATIRRGDRVIIKASGGEVAAKEVVRQSAERIELRSLNPDHENYALRVADLAWMARIVWVSQ